jgi:hypothetical protein
MERTTTGALPLALGSGLDCEVVDERRDNVSTGAPWRFLEVWTQNRIYALDLALRCFDVLDRGSLRPVPEHGLLGARLVGGQRRTDGGLELLHPFPAPGFEAVFEQHVRGKVASFSYSSTVTRVVMRLRRVAVEGETAEPPWQDVASSGLADAAPSEPPAAGG